uniref:Uncharacterized protein n=1 Tax=Arundo donax TaxID=35708 RepID=A0A0A9BVE0_ARUDO
MILYGPKNRGPSLPLPLLTKEAIGRCSNRTHTQSPTEKFISRCFLSY